MEVKLIAMDLDGTLLNRQKNISQENLQALENAKASGILLAAATGRPLSTLPSCVRDNPAFSYAITSNGAEVYRLDTGEQICSVCLTPRSVDVIRETVGDAAVGWEAFVKGQAYGEAGYVERPWEFGVPVPHVGYIKKTRRPVADMQEFLREHRQEIIGFDLAFGDPALKEEIVRKLKACGEPIFVTSFMEHCIEIIHKDAGKAEGIRQICGREGISPAETAAFGDAENDLDMIEYAGTGIAMGNAHASVKEKADYVTGDNEHHGVAEAFRSVFGILSQEERCMHERFMREALRQAEKAEVLEEVPIGCVIVKDGRIIARGYNRRNTDKNTLSHAELNAIRKASRKLGDWRLEGCTMYITLEPCQMCAGALVQSRIDRIVLGGKNPKAGCAGSVLNLLQVEAFNHQVEILDGILTEECSSQLSAFFRKLREQKECRKQS